MTSQETGLSHRKEANVIRREGEYAANDAGRSSQDDSGRREDRKELKVVKPLKT